MLTLQLLKRSQRRSIYIQLDGDFKRNSQLTHGPPPSKISEKSMHERKHHSLKNLHLKDVVVQVTMPVCGRASAMVCAKSAKTAATERAENFIFCEFDFSEMEFFQMMFLSVFHQVTYTASETPLIGSISYAVIRVYSKYSFHFSHNSRSGPFDLR